MLNFIKKTDSKEKLVINEIKNKANKIQNDSEYTDFYEEYNGMKQALADNLYSKNSHFIYELIQNAEDNSYYDVEKSSFKFVIEDNGILTQNNEIGFNEDNIKSICKFSSSSKKGNKELGYIGEKGLGFKSVFAISDKPSIFSNGYQFHFKEGEYTIPYWIENKELNEYPKEFSEKGMTNIYLPFKENFLYKEDIEEKIKDIEPIVLLFLSKLKNLEIIKGQQSIVDVKRFERFKTGKLTKVTLSYNEFIETYYVVKKTIEKPVDIEEPKREMVKKREVILAFPDLGNRVKEDRVFSFLPTEMHTGLKFLIQSDFLLTGSRESIIEDNRWNLWIMDEMVDFFLDAIEEIKVIYPLYFLNYLETYRSYNTFIDKYYQEILDEIKYKNIFLTTEGESVSFREICILEDYSFMSKIFDGEKYTTKDGKVFKFLNKSFKIPLNLSEKWNLKRIRKRDILNYIGENSKIFAKRFEEDNQLYEEVLDYIGEFFFEKDRYDYHRDSFENIEGEILKRLPVIPIEFLGSTLFFSKNELEKEQIFFKLDNKGILKEIFSDLKIIANKYSTKLERIGYFRDCFKIKSPNILEILENLDKEAKILKDEESNIKLLVYLKNNLGEDKDKIRSLLREKYFFLSKNDQFFKNEKEWGKGSYCKLYLAKEYFEYTTDSMENFVFNNCYSKYNRDFDFISDKYLEFEAKNSEIEVENLKKEWITFFRSLNINDEIKLINQNYTMYSKNSYGVKKIKNIDLSTIPFIGNVDSDNIYRDNNSFYAWCNPFEKNINLSDLSDKDTLFFIRKLSELFSIESSLNLSYERVDKFNRKLLVENETLPWIKIIRETLKIFLGEEKVYLKDLYIESIKGLERVFKTVPIAYLKEEGSKCVLKDLFGLKKSPDNNELIKLLRTKRVYEIEKITRIFNHLNYTDISKEKILLSEIPVNINETVKYIPIYKAVWKDTYGIGLNELESSYGKALKQFFVNKIGISEKPTILQCVEYLCQKPKNHKTIFNNIIIEMEKELDNNSQVINLDLLRNKRFIQISNNLFSFNEIIYNDENLDTKEIPNLLNIPNKLKKSFDKISNFINIKKVSDYQKKYTVKNKMKDLEVIDIYRELLNYYWDYLYSKNIRFFNDLKKDKDKIIELGSINKGAFGDILFQILLDGNLIENSEDLIIEGNEVILSKKLDKRKIPAKLSEAIVGENVSQRNILELFYKSVFIFGEYSKEEYYLTQEIEEPQENDDKFDEVFKELIRKNQQDLFDIQNSEKALEERSLKKIKVEKTEEAVTESVDTQTSNVKKEISITKVHNLKSVEINKVSKDIHLDNGVNKTLENHKPNSSINQFLGKIKNGLKSAIEKHDASVEVVEENLNPDILLDEDGYRKESQKKLQNDIQNKALKSYTSTYNKKINEDTVKMFLQNEYRGHCQVCGFTFDKKDNKGKYFEVLNFKSKLRSKEVSDIVEEGASLSVCPTCHAGIKHGDFESLFLKGFNSSDIDLENKTVEVDDEKIPKTLKEVELDLKKLPIRLFNEERVIYYTETHFEHLQMSLNLSK